MNISQIEAIANDACFSVNQEVLFFIWRWSKKLKGSSCSSATNKICKASISRCVIALKRSCSCWWSSYTRATWMKTGLFTCSRWYRSMHSNGTNRAGSSSARITKPLKNMLKIHSTAHSAASSKFSTSRIKLKNKLSKSLSHTKTLVIDCSCGRGS